MTVAVGIRQSRRESSADPAEPGLGIAPFGR
jgi:hypothetical protein